MSLPKAYLILFLPFYKKMRGNEENMEEIWKDIPGYEGIYQASTLGRIKSTKRNIIMKQGVHRDGYYKIKLSNHGKRKWHQAHRLIALTFIDNPNELKCVNHIDENKLNNNISNLEWCTTSYNNCYGTRLQRVANSNKNKRPIVQYDLKGRLIAEYPSITEASRKTKATRSNISRSCNAKGIKPRKYIFRYKEEAIR